MCLRLLLGCLVREAPFVLAEVNGENWVPARWMHWVFPCDIGDSYGLEHRVTLLSADAFLDANPTWWREILERIVGRAERTVAGFFLRITCGALMHLALCSLKFRGASRGLPGFFGGFVSFEALARGLPQIFFWCLTSITRANACGSFGQVGPWRWHLIGHPSRSPWSSATDRLGPGRLRPRTW